MRLAKSSRTANLPEARAGGPSQARSNNPQQQQQYQQHQMTATTNVTEPVGAAQSQNQIVDDAIWRPADAVGHDQYHAQPPPSNVAATSQLDAANEMDFGVKFMGGRPGRDAAHSNEGTTNRCCYYYYYDYWRTVPAPWSATATAAATSAVHADP
ncbi:general substrate transporter [Apiospora arundinis]